RGLGDVYKRQVSMLESLPGLGKVKARKIMEEVGIADNRKIQGLGAQQKKALLEHLAK
ncbi:MAG: integration host factor, partial [Acidimicrobiia bacterium]|nr:integration host factor [Acidimicrobiia bacterium]